MRALAFKVTVITLLLAASAVEAREGQRLYRWVDGDGQVHFGDTIPAEYAEMDKQVLNEHGITVELLRGKKSAAAIAEEKRLERIAREIELQRRADQALLATYMSIEEILMHRDRRVELFQAQTRVTELYLRNLQRRMENLLSSASGFQPYNDDPDAPMIDRDLSDEIAATRETIARHEGNLQRFRSDETNIVKRFEGDIIRFKKLKGLDQQAAVTSPHPE